MAVAQIQEEQVSFQLNPQNKPADEIELTEEEISAILAKALLDKRARVRERQYWDQISKPVEYKALSTDELWIHIQLKAKEMIPDFSFDKDNAKILETLCMYFAKDKEFEKAGEGYSLNKGLLLFGPVGCGKTTIMRLFAVNPTNAFNLVSCRKVAADYVKKEGGEELVDNLYCGPVEVYPTMYFGQTEIGTCFDDLGTEQNKAHFSNRLNVMEYVLLNRYDNFRLKGKTHTTTNLTIDQIEEQYGERVRSRAMEMFNFILFNEYAEDRRK